MQELWEERGKAEREEERFCFVEYEEEKSKRMLETGRGKSQADDLTTSTQSAWLWEREGM